ncbi:MAG: hypothetical protein V1779_08940 [bacterium]
MKKNKDLNIQDVLFKEIDIIQDIIKRMANNSFLMKGWTITLVVGTLLLKNSKEQSFIAFIPLIVFWYLDAYFLWQERMYRKLYNWVITNRLETKKMLFDMNATRFIKDVDSKIKIMFSITLRWFYLSILIVLLIYIIIIFKTDLLIILGC